MASEALLSLLVQLRDEASAGIAALGGNVEQLGQQAQQTQGFWGSMFSNATNIASSIGLLQGVGGAIAGVGQSLIAGSAEFEGYEARFASLMGSTDLAKAKIQELSTFASTTPFELPDVIKASQSLQVFGGAALNTKENLAIVGNAAAATGQNIGDVSFWFARAYSAIQNGQPFGEAAQNLQQMGVMSGDTVVKLNPLKESGASNTEVWNQFAGSLNAPTDAMAKMGGTWTGLTSTLSDSWALLVRTFGQPLFETLKPQMQGVIDALSSGGLIDAVSSLGTAFASVLAPAIGFVADTVIPGVVAAIEYIAPAVSTAISVLSQIGSIFGEMAGEALAWGANIINQLAVGIMSAAGPVIAAINSIGSVIAGLLMPGSPPAFLPALDQWGTGAMDAYLEGWGQADFGVFNSISESIKGALDGIAKASGDKGMNIAGILLGSQDEIASAVNEVRQFGKVSEETFNSLVAAIGPVGPEVSGLVSAYLDLQAATQNVASAQNELNAVTEEYAGKLAPLNAQLKGIQNQKQAIQDQKKLADLQTKLADQSLSDADRQLAMLEQQEIMTRQQIRTTEADRDASVGASKAKLDAAKQEQAAAQARVNQQKALVEAQNKTNALIGEQTKAMAGAAGAMKGAASAAAPLAEAVQGVNQVVGSMKQTIEGAGSSIQSTGMVISTAFSPAVLFVKNNIDGLMGALSGIAAVLGAAAVWGVATSVITALGGAIAFLLSPIGLLIVGAAALGAAISTNFLGLGTLAQSLMATFSQLGGVLSQAFAAFQEGGLGAAIQTLITGIGPILTQLGTTIVTWITTQGPIIAAQLLSWGTAFIEWITATIPQVVAGLLGLATAIWEWIKGAAPQLATQLGEWAVAFVGWLPEAISQLLAGLAGVIGAITTWIVEHGPDIIATLASWGAGFGSWVLDTALPALLGALGELWTNFTGWLSENGPSILAQLSTWGAAFGTWVTETALPALTTALGELWTNFTGWLVEKGPGILAQLGEWAVAFGTWVKEKAWPFLLAALGDLFTNLTGWLREKGPGILAQLGEWAVAFGTWVKEKAWPFLLAALGDLFTNLTGWLREKGPGILAQLGEWGAAFGGWVKDKAIPALTTALGDLATKLFGWISEQAKKLIDSAGAMGKSLIDGFVKGIAGGVGRVIDAAKNMAKSVYDAAMGALQSNSPSRLFTKVGGTVPAGLDQGITAGMPKVTTNLVNGIMNLAGKAGAAIEAGTKAMSAAASYSGAGGSGLSGFLAAFSDLAIQFNDAAVALGGRILGTATRFADTIGKVVAPIDTALKALGGLVDFVAPARANISAFIASMYVLLNALNNMAAMFEAKAIKAAAVFAEGAGKMLGVVSPAIDALKKLPDLVVPAQSQVNAFGESLFLIVRELLNVAALFGEQSLKAGAAFGEAGAKLLGVVAPAIDALKTLPNLVVPADGALATFGDALTRTMQTLIGVAALFAQEAVDAAAKFAEGAGKVLGILKAGVDGLNAVREFGPIGYEAITAFAMAVDQMVALMAQVADDVGVAATDAAAKFSEGAGKVLSILKSGVDGLAGVRDLGPIGYEAIESFTMAVDQIVAYMAMAAEDVGVAAAEAAAKFSEGAGKVLAIVKSGVEGLVGLRDLGPVGVTSITRFVMAVDQIVAYMAMAAEDVGVAAADAAAAFASGAGKVLALLKTGVDGLTSLATFAAPAPKAIQSFGATIVAVLRQIEQVSAAFSAEAVASAAAFATNVSTVVSQLKGALQAFASLGDTTVKPAVLGAFMQAAQSLIAQMATYLPPNAEVIGSNTIVGLINGIYGQRSNLIAAMTNTVLAAVQAAQAALGIASPSKVFEQLGQYTGQGMAGGMNAMQPAVASAGAGLGMAAVGGASGSVGRRGGGAGGPVNITFAAGAIAINGVQGGLNDKHLKTLAGYIKEDIAGDMRGALVTYINKLGSLYLNNTAGVVVAGGDPTVGALTPFAVRADWTPQPAELDAVFAGGGPLGGAPRLAYASYAPVVEELIPIGVEGSSHNNAQRVLGLLRAQLRRGSRHGPIVWRMRPAGALWDAYTEVYGGTVEDTPGGGDAGIGPAEGGYQLDATITLRRAAFWGSDTLETLISAASVANRVSGSPHNVTAYATPTQGELTDEGQPLNVTIAKPASMAAALLYLATIESRSGQSIASTKTAITSTTGSAFTAGSAIDVTALRTKPGLRLHGFARLTTITAPTKIKLQLTFQNSAGATLWAGPWVAIGSNTSAQLVDLLGTTLDGVRLPGSGAITAIPVVHIKSTDGTAVTATLDTLDILLAYTVGAIDGGAGLASGQSYQVHAAQNYAGGGWLPLPAPRAAIVDSSTGAFIRSAMPRGELPVALAGASLWLAWVDTGGAHTATDTTTITAQQAPLWHTLRGAT